MDTISTQTLDDVARETREKRRILRALYLILTSQAYVMLCGVFEYRVECKCSVEDGISEGR
jgi:hypothetical protein